jgi:hypothetical protein
VVVERRLVGLRELLAVLFDVRADLICSLVTVSCRSSGPTVIPPSGTNVRCRPMKPSLTVANCGSSFSTST